jgi:hypothetical protein
VTGAGVATAFWLSLFVFHAEGNSWPVSVLLAFSGMVAGLLLVFGFNEWKRRHDQN